MLRQRLVSAALLLPLVVAAAWLGGLWFTAFVTLALALGAREFAAMGTLAGHRVTPWISVSIAVAFALERGLLGGRLEAAVAVASLLTVAVWYVLHYQTPTRTEAMALTLLAGVYVGFLGSHFIALRALPNGLAWLALAIVTTWVSDTGAYGVGRALGRRKMAPVLSPNKTWEGAAGGFVTAVVCGGAIAAVARIGVGHGVVVGVLLGVFCPFGDLAISMVKRQVGVKDTGKLIPGHGGALDRLDSLLFAAPLVYLYATIVAAAFT